MLGGQTIYPTAPWAPALGGQGGHVPTLEKIWVGIAHPTFPSLVGVWVTTTHPGFLCKGIMIIKQFRFTFSDLGGQRCSFAQPKHYIQGGQT